MTLTPEEKEAWREAVAARQLKKDEFVAFAQRSPRHAEQARVEIERRIRKFAESFTAVLLDIDRAAHVAEGDCATKTPSNTKER